MQKRVMITGAASGIGLETSLQMAERGYHVIAVDRNADGGQATVKRILDAGGSAEFRQLDLGNLAKIREVAQRELALGKSLDVMINNAGLLPPLKRATTADGFELVFGVAYLGHFALTGLLLPALLRSEQPRVVSNSSISHTSGRIDFDDLQFERSYSDMRAYPRAKLACLMFGLELDRRAKAAGSKLISVTAHPGVSRTPIAAGWEKEDRRKLKDRLELLGYRLFMLFGQAAADGAKSLVYAATEPSVTGGGYYGPTGLGQFTGRPGPVKAAKHALDPAVAERLWAVSEKLTGVSFNL